jgi:exodeoxyribonuclease V alpha subunit
MQIRNNYDKGTAGVFNGSVGVVTALSLEDQELRVQLDEDEEVGYGFEELDELTHAYAVSIHRSQGSEYPCAVVPVTTSAWLMLQRNLLYTAVTRAKRLVVLVGSRRALAKAVRSQGAGRRHTALTERLQQGRARTVGAVSRPWDGRLQQVPVEPAERIRDRVGPAGRSG